MKPIIPAIIHSTIQTATKVPPKIAPTIDEANRRIGINLLLALNISAEKIIVKKAAKTPNHPN